MRYQTESKRKCSRAPTPVSVLPVTKCDAMQLGKIARRHILEDYIQSPLHCCENVGSRIIGSASPGSVRLEPGLQAVNQYIHSVTAWSTSLYTALLKR
jgi:hypothetical protein